MNFGIIYFLILFVFLFIGLILPIKKVGRFLIITNFVIAIPAFFVHPPEGIFWDTIRFSNLLNAIRGYNYLGIYQGLNWALTSSQYSSQPLDAIYIWFFSLFKQNGYLFSVTTFIFLLFLSIFIVISTKKNKSNKNSAIITQFLILTIFCIFYEISGIRNFLAYMIFALCLYMDLTTKDKSKKYLAYLGYIFAYEFHPAVLPFLILRIFLMFRSRIVYVCVCVISFIYTLFLNILIPLIGNVGFLSVISEKAQLYLHGQENYGANATNGEILITTLILISLVVELVLYINSNYKQIYLDKYIKYYILSMFFTIGSFLSVQVYLRSIMLLLFLSIPIKSVLFSNSNKNYIGHSIIIYRYFTFILSIIMSIYWYVYVYQNVLI